MPEAAAGPRVLEATTAVPAAPAADAEMPAASEVREGRPATEEAGRASGLVAAVSFAESAEVHEVETAEPGREGSRVRGVITSRSTWRWPSEPGKLPHYVRAQFHFKSFGLIAAQCLVAFCIAAGVEVGLRQHTPEINKGGFSFALFVAMGCFTMLTLLLLLCVQRLYPANYMVLCLVTLLVGVTWGMGGTSLATHMHFQLFGILCVATSFAAGFSALGPRSGLTGRASVGLPLFVGWAIGSVAEAIIAWRLGAHPVWSGLAVLLAGGQILWVLLDVGDKLQECNPDDFMRIVISMDSTLLVVVSIPLFVVAACFLHSNREVEQNIQNDRAAPAAGENAEPV